MASKYYRRVRRKGPGAQSSSKAESSHLKILCLHGRRQTAEIFKDRIHKLRKRCSSFAKFFFAEGPHKLPREAGVPVAMHCWKNPHGSNPVEGLEESFAHLTSFCSKHGPFDGILGFSEGAGMAPALATRLWRGDVRRPFVIVCGGYVLEGDWDTSLLPSIPSLHVTGQRDIILSSAESRRLFELFHRGDCTGGAEHHWWVHPKGHLVPQRVVDLDKIVQFMKAQMKKIPSSLPKTVSAAAAVKTPERVAVAEEEVAAASAPPVPEPEPEEAGVTYGPMTEEHEDELEALQAIFDEDFEVLARDPVTVLITVTDIGEDEEKQVTLRFRLPLEYPLTPGVYPRMDVQSDTLEMMSSKWRKDLIDHLLQSECVKMCGVDGEQIIYAVVDEAKEYLSDLLEKERAKAKVAPPPIPETAEQTVEEEVCAPFEPEIGTEPLLLTPKHAEEFERLTSEWVGQASKEAAAVDRERRSYTAPKGYAECWPKRSSSAVDDDEEEGPNSERGEWKYVIGLVGKPSAGKSTFFNAATDPDDPRKLAKVGAFPFTTIDPNIGRGTFLVPSPSAPVAMEGTQRVAVKMKDVAGLVPGAYKGRGRGNAFLNDLVDADVLIHIVDASGTTDAEGNANYKKEKKASTEKDGVKAGGSEIDWIRGEIHRWIYNNLAAKWRSVCRKEQKFFQMFSGYQAPPSLVLEALDRAKINTKDLVKQLVSWSPLTLHRVVAHFLRVRFPILLALNKVDLPTASSEVSRIRNHFPHEPAVECSAHAACEMQKNKVSPSITALTTRLGDTCGVMDVVNAAVSLRPPKLVFPVKDLERFLSLDEGRDKPKGSDKSQRLVVLMKPRSTVEDVYHVLRRPPYLYLRGDYVRAECCAHDLKVRPTRKTELLSINTQWLRIMTNKRSTTTPLGGGGGAKSLKSKGKAKSSKGSGFKNKSKNSTAGAAMPAATTKRERDLNRLLGRLKKSSDRQGKSKGGKGTGQV